MAGNSNNKAVGLFKLRNGSNSINCSFIKDVGLLCTGDATAVTEGIQLGEVGITKFFGESLAFLLNRLRSSGISHTIEMLLWVQYVKYVKA